MTRDERIKSLFDEWAERQNKSYDFADPGEVFTDYEIFIAGYEARENDRTTMGEEEAFARATLEKNVDVFNRALVKDIIIDMQYLELDREWMHDAVFEISKMLKEKYLTPAPDAR